MMSGFLALVFFLTNFTKPLPGWCPHSPSSFLITLGPFFSSLLPAVISFLLPSVCPALMLVELR